MSHRRTCLNVVKTGARAQVESDAERHKFWFVPTERGAYVKRATLQRDGKAIQPGVVVHAVF